VPGAPAGFKKKEAASDTGTVAASPPRLSPPEAGRLNPGTCTAGEAHAIRRIREQTRGGLDCGLERMLSCTD
jgi:hypothetical protein